MKVFDASEESNMTVVLFGFSKSRVDLNYRRPDSNVIEGDNPLSSATVRGPDNYLR